MTVTYFEPLRRWGPRRVWIGYAGAVDRLFTPLGKFINGETHKRYFRIAGTALVAVFATAVNIRFTGDARWIAYLLGFACISAVYWLVYAPAKWAHKDNLLDSTMHLFEDQKVRTTELTNPVFDPIGRDIVWQGDPPSELRQPPTEEDLPLEIQVLRHYVKHTGRYLKRGTYLHMRQWSPPGCWRGHLEYTTLINTVERYESLGHMATTDDDQGYLYDEYLDDLLEKGLRASYTLLALTLYFDGNFPQWRKRARFWANGGTRGWIVRCMSRGASWVKYRVLGRYPSWSADPEPHFSGSTESRFRRKLRRTRESP